MPLLILLLGMYKLSREIKINRFQKGEFAVFAVFETFVIGVNQQADEDQLIDFFLNLGATKNIKDKKS